MKLKQAFLSRKQSLLIASLLAASPALAQQAVPADSLKTYQAKEVVVTATRSTISKENVPQSITLIQEEDIRLTPAQEFTDLLKKNSTVNIIQYPGLLSGIGIRGFRPQTGGLNQRVLLLLDGRPAGTTNLSTINPGNIERIEVLKGPASALYGSQAMGGVVNVITKKSAGKISSRVYAEYGSYQSFQAGAATGGNISDKLDYDLSFTTFDRNKNFKLGEGNLFRDLLGAGTATKFYEAGAEKVDDSRGDGERRTYTRLSYHTGSLRLGYQLNSNWRVDVKGDRFVANNVESPSDIAVGNTQPSTKDMERSNGELSLNGTLGNHDLQLRGYLANELTDNYTLYDWGSGSLVAPYISYNKESEWKGIQLKDVYSLDRHQLVFGVDYNHASTYSHSYTSEGVEKSPYSPNYSLISTGIYLQGHFTFFNERLVVTPGARYDFITFEGHETPLLTKYTAGKETNPFLSPSLGVQYQLIAPLRFHATIGRAFVTPDAYNVAGYSVSDMGTKVAIIHGNPELENENSLSWDAGIRFQQEGSGFSADLTYFSTHVKDRITTQRTIPETVEYTESGDTISSYTTYVNANEANIRGLEAELAYDFGALANYRYSLRLFAHATATFAAEEVTIQKDGSEKARDIYNVPGFSSVYGVDYNSFSGLNLRLNSRYVGKRKDTDYNDPLYPEIEYPAFMVMDLTAAYTLADKHTLTLFVNNLTDENYYEKRGFNMPGRNFSLRYSLSF